MALFDWCSLIAWVLCWQLFVERWITGRGARPAGSAGDHRGWRRHADTRGRRSCLSLNTVTGWQTINKHRVGVDSTGFVLWSSLLLLSPANWKYVVKMSQVTYSRGGVQGHAPPEIVLNLDRYRRSLTLFRNIISPFYTSSQS